MFYVLVFKTCKQYAYYIIHNVTIWVNFIEGIILSYFYCQKLSFINQQSLMKCMRNRQNKWVLGLKKACHRKCMTQGKECPRKRTFHRNSHVTATGIKHVDIKFSAHGARRHTYFSDVGPLVLLLQTLLRLFRFPCFRFWAQLMKVVPETRQACHRNRYMSATDLSLNHVCHLKRPHETETLLSP